MTATIEIIITCDGGLPGCRGTFCDGDKRFLSAAEQRRSFAHEEDSGGRWRHFQQKDYCPVCWPTLRRAQPQGDKQP